MEKTLILNDDENVLEYFGNGCYITVNLIKITSRSPRMVAVNIKCIEKTTKKLLSFIPREAIAPELLKIRQVTGFVKLNQLDGKLYCELTEVQAPSSEEYARVKTICQEKNLPMPAYDVRAFNQFNNWFALFGR